MCFWVKCGTLLNEGLVLCGGVWSSRVNRAGNTLPFMNDREIEYRIYIYNTCDIIVL